MLRNVKVLIILSGLALLFLAPGGAAADYTMSLSDNTWMQPWQGNAPAASSTGWGNWTSSPIADAPASNWEISKVNIIWSGPNLEMQIFTNYPQAGLDGAGQTDIALSRGTGASNFNVGVDLNGALGAIGGIYSVSSWKTPQDFWAAGGWIYTGRYDTLNSTINPKVPYTEIGTTTGSLGQAQANFITRPAGSDTLYMWDILFPNFNADGSWNSFQFTLGSGSCANDFFAGTAIDSSLPPTGNTAPIPASFMLLASGLLALTILGFRKKAMVVQEDKREDK